ncbi:hypothetical protein D5S18_33555 [Nocardia panacis]|uniref:Uncharacterized protein n=1 Tax=Nocardia panacis TaxID=2340916 RepID=A0A3A4K7Y7_9NOCA|nr:hypothetical protein [Nocardia panacis]RJO68344.1 hypothetical protein D5S18_33555 [Nocardia panacis]
MIRQDGPIIGWIDDDPIPRVRLDDRLAALHRGSRAAALPQPGTGDYRQLVRWTAHVLCTEELCRRVLPGTMRNPVVELDSVSAIQLGSINAAAWYAEPAVAACFRRLFPEPAATGAAESSRWWQLSYSTGVGQPPSAPIPLTSMGWTTLDDLPPVLAAATRNAMPGRTTGPHIDENRWYYLRLDQMADRPLPQHRDQGDRLREFARELDRLRRRSLVMAPGFEHPGDPAQPDNTHRH